MPDTAKTPEVVEMEDYFRELIRGIDSSLLEEWERLRNPEFVAAETGEKPARPATFDITRDADAFRRLVRTTILGFLQDVAARDWEAAAARVTVFLPPEITLETAQLAETRRIEKEFAAYFEARGRFLLDPEGRATKHTHWTEDHDAGAVQIAQILADTEGKNDWEARFTLSLATSRQENRPVLKFELIRPVGTE